MGINMDYLRQYTREYRPVYHFSAPKGWLNDPNGLIYFEGYYHLYYQYYPEGSFHGPMHWGHARSRDLIRWEDLPPVLYPDELGEIFSGSMVYDRDNTSGFGKNGKGPLVAVFTHHLERDGRVVQSQSLAYSLDGGNTFEKYAQNPVLNLELRDFRDPKVFYWEPGGCWIMVLSAGTEARIYASADLKSWTYQSSFGGVRHPGEIWECPDLFPMKACDGRELWVFLVSSIVPEEGHSCVLYFVGSFDGKSFAPLPASGGGRLLDLGLDCYAPVTFGNVPDRTILLGWQNRWAYAERVPENGYRGSMTFPRELALAGADREYRLLQYPAGELLRAAVAFQAGNGSGGVTGAEPASTANYEAMLPEGPFLLEINSGLPLLELELTNGRNTFKIQINTQTKELYVSRASCFPGEPAGEWLTPGLAGGETGCPGRALLLVDTNSVELYWGEGDGVCSMLYFVEEPFRKLNTNVPKEERTLYGLPADGLLLTRETVG